MRDESGKINSDFTGHKSGRLIAQILNFPCIFQLSTPRAREGHMPREEKTQKLDSLKRIDVRWFDPRYQDADGIQLTFTYPNYGGRRTWLVCPQCERRGTYLYDLHTHTPDRSPKWVCRVCTGLKYPSQGMGTIRRIEDRRKKVRQKLNHNYLFIRPRYMREEKFNRLYDRHFELSEDLKRERVINAVRAVPQILTTRKESAAWLNTVVAALESGAPCILRKDRITLPSARTDVWKMVKRHTETKGRERVPLTSAGDKSA